MRLQWQPYPKLRQGLRARKGPLYADIWLVDMPGGDHWQWSVYAVLGPLGWCHRHGIAQTRQLASDAANDAVPEVEAEMRERFPDLMD